MNEYVILIMLYLASFICEKKYLAKAIIIYTVIIFLYHYRTLIVLFIKIGVFWDVVGDSC